jgi:hypothetical protein
MKRVSRFALFARGVVPAGVRFPFIKWNKSALGAVAQLAGFISVADWIGSSFEIVGRRDETKRRCSPNTDLYH